MSRWTEWMNESVNRSPWKFKRSSSSKQSHLSAAKGGPWDIAFRKKWKLFQQAPPQMSLGTVHSLKPKGPICWYTSYGWGGKSESHPAMLFRTDSSGSLFPRTREEEFAYCCAQQRWSPILFSPLVCFEYIFCKGTEVTELGILLSCSYKSK